MQYGSYHKRFLSESSSIPRSHAAFKIRTSYQKFVSPTEFQEYARHTISSEYFGLQEIWSWKVPSEYPSSLIFKFKYPLWYLSEWPPCAFPDILTPQAWGRQNKNDAGEPRMTLGETLCPPLRKKNSETLRDFQSCTQARQSLDQNPGLLCPKTCLYLGNCFSTV